MKNRLMKYVVFLIGLLPFFGLGQVPPEKEKDTTLIKFMVIEGDTIYENAIGLNEVILLERLQFSSSKDHRRYLILKRKTIKVYPYAKLAAERLEALNERLEKLKTKRERRQYAKIIQRYIEDEFTEELKKLTRTEGQILVKLVHRQTGITTFDLIKQLRSGWKAFWWQNTAKLFDISLKQEFNPMENKEDFLIEDILERAFQSGQLDRQRPAVPIDYYDLTDKWLNPKTVKK